ncbi:hypothetical protein TWF730_000025 [Orbilia blumenaviensis]|uniref:Uncharacterized protein n=1 Tax=Orbilia blumenaviensis TaxID=1796055 RepID=A0AAV9VMM1_9PEZI
MTRSIPSHAVANMWFESQSKEQRNSFEVPSWSTLMPTDFMTFFFLPICVFILLFVHYFHQEGPSKSTFTPMIRTQRNSAPYQERHSPSLEIISPPPLVQLAPAIQAATYEVPLTSPSPLSSQKVVISVEGQVSAPNKFKKPIKYRYTVENPHHMCGHSCLPPTVTGPPPSKCTHPNHIRHAPRGEEFELVSIEDGLGRFDTIPMMSVLEQWEQDRLLSPASIVSCQTNTYLNTLSVQSSCYSYEQVLYCNVIACMLEIFESHAPKMLRNKKKIGGSYYYHLCEMLREPDNEAAAATFMMTVSLGKRAEMLATKNPWGPECMKPSLLSLWNLFHDLIAISDEQLEETIETWARTAKEWSLAMIYLKMAHKRLWQESPLYLTGADIHDSKSDSEKAQTYVQQCLRAGDDKEALACQDLACLRQEVLHVHKRMESKLNDSRALRKMTPYDIDLLKFYTATLGQLCTTGNMVNALVAWRNERGKGMKKIRALAIERKCRDLTMQELAGGTDSGSDQEQSDSELSSVSSVAEPNSSSVSIATLVSSVEIPIIGVDQPASSLEDQGMHMGGIEVPKAKHTLIAVDPKFVPEDVLESTKIWEGGMLL